MTDIATTLETLPVHDTVDLAVPPLTSDADAVEEVLVEEVSIDGMCGVY